MPAKPEKCATTILFHKDTTRLSEPHDHKRSCSNMIDPNEEMLGIRRRSAATSTEEAIGDGRRLRRAQSCWTLRPTKDADMDDRHLEPQDDNVVFEGGAHGIYSRRWKGLTSYKAQSNSFDQSCWSPVPTRLGPLAAFQIETTLQQQQSIDEGIYKEVYGLNQRREGLVSTDLPYGASTALTMGELVTPRMYEDRDHHYHWDDQTPPLSHSKSVEDDSEMVLYGDTIAQPPRRGAFKIKFIAFDGSEAKVLEEVLVVDPADPVVEKTAEKYAICGMFPSDKFIWPLAGTQSLPPALEDGDKAIILVPEGRRLAVKERRITGFKRPAEEEAISDHFKKFCP